MAGMSFLEASAAFSIPLLNLYVGFFAVFIVNFFFSCSFGSPRCSAEKDAQGIEEMSS
jgi:hypothetical protein